MKKKILIFLSLIAVSVLISTTALAAGGLYTSYNMWYEFDRIGNVKPMSDINYKKGTMVPAGTKVSKIDIGSGRRGASTINFTLAKGRKMSIVFQPKYHPGLSVQQFKDRLFTSKSLAALTKGFTKKEKKSVKLGTLKVGLRKKAVLVAYGYPPEHETSSTKENEWKYWTSRFRTKIIYFDKKGKTMAPPKANDDL